MTIKEAQQELETLTQKENNFAEVNQKIRGVLIEVSRRKIELENIIKGQEIKPIDSLIAEAETAIKDLVAKAEPIEGY